MFWDHLAASIRSYIIVYPVQGVAITHYEQADFLIQCGNHLTAIRNCKKANIQCCDYQWCILFEARRGGGGYWSIVYQL